MIPQIIFLMKNIPKSDFQKLKIYFKKEPINIYSLYSFLCWKDGLVCLFINDKSRTKN